MIVNKKSFVILSIILILTMFLALGCTDSSPEEEKVMEEVVEILTEDDSEDSADTSTADEPEKEEQIDPPVFSFAVEYGNEKYSSVDDVMQIFGIFESRPNIEFHIDDLGDNPYGDPSVVPGGYQPFADIIGWGHGFLEYPTAFSAPPPSDIWPPGYYDPHLNSWTVYPSNWQPYEGKQWYMTFIVLDAEVPRAHGSLTGTHASVSVTDGNPDNKFVPLQQYPDDFNKGTNRWDTMRYVPGTEWIYMASGENFAEIPTSAFGFYYGNLVAWLYPAIEVDPEYFSWRGWVHWIDINWDPATSGAGVTGGVPIQDPVPVVNTLPARLFEDQNQRITRFEGNYEFCSQNTCIKKYEGEGDDLSFWCECGGCTANDGCDCHLFQDDLNRVYQNPYLQIWDYAAGPGVKVNVPYGGGYRLSCFCVKAAE